MDYKYWSKIHATGDKPYRVMYLTNDLDRLMHTFTSIAIYTRLEISMHNWYQVTKEQRNQAIIKTLKYDR